MHNGWRIVLLGGLLASLLTGCATVKGWVGRGEDQPAPAASTEAAAETVTIAAEEDPETTLRRVVEREIAAADHQSAANPDQLIRRRPYWLKEYVEYPDDANMLDIEIQETESRTQPYIADVKLNKIRYSTRLHRERAQAAADTNFLRDTGEETITYEYRNGRWVRMGSLFVAETTEEKVGGVWQPVQEEVTRVETAEEEPGFFNRTLNWITGR